MYKKRAKNQKGFARAFVMASNLFHFCTNVSALHEIGPVDWIKPGRAIKAAARPGRRPWF